MKTLKVLGLAILVVLLTWFWIIPQANKYRESKTELKAMKELYNDIKLNPKKYFRFRIRKN